jgi:hypothetical protein
MMTPPDNRKTDPAPAMSPETMSQRELQELVAERLANVAARGEELAEAVLSLNAQVGRHAAALDHFARDWKLLTDRWLEVHQEQQSHGTRIAKAEARLALVEGETIQ